MSLYITSLLRSRRERENPILQTASFYMKTQINEQI